MDAAHTAVATCGRLRAISPEDDAGLATVARLHMELLGFGPLAGLGEYAVREIGYRVNMADDGLLKVALYEVDGQPAGFVAYTHHSISFHRSSLRRHWRRVAVVLALAVLREPWRVPRLLRVARVIVSRRGEVRLGADPLGEVVAIAVRREYLAPAFVRRTGIRIPEELIAHAMAYLRRAGVREMRMLVDAFNKAALLMYHRLGARMEPYRQGGEPMVHVWFALDAAAPAAPQCWSPHPGRGSAGPAPEGWRGYWESISHARTFRIEAADYVARLQRAVALERHWRVLDFGCGFGYVADLLATKVARLGVWDASATMRARARLNLAAHDNVEFLDLSDRARLHEAGAFDLILVHSVIQYMERQELAAWLAGWGALLAARRGRLVVSDVIVPGSDLMQDIAALIRFSARRGSLRGVLLDGARELSRYRSVRERHPLLVLTRPEIEGLARTAGLAVAFLPENLSFRPGRLTAVFHYPPVVTA